MINEQDTLLDEEKRIIHVVFDLGDAVARVVMIPRVDVTMVEDSRTVTEVMELMRQTGYSRVPVYRGPRLHRRYRPYKGSHRSGHGG